MCAQSSVSISVLYSRVCEVPSVKNNIDHPVCRDLTCFCDSNDVIQACNNQCWLTTVSCAGDSSVDCPNSYVPIGPT